MLEAADEMAAKRKAARHGKESEHEYRNQTGEVVYWSFERVERICEIESNVLKDGTALFSRFLRDSEAKSILTPFED